MTLYVGFSTPKSWKIGAEAIKWWTKRDYSHVFVAWKAERFSRVLVYHAAHGKVHFLSSERLLAENHIVKLYALEITDEHYRKLVQRCIDLAGEEYGYAELIKILVKDICDSHSIQCKMVENSRGYICSELLAELLIGLGADFARPTFLVRPDQIEDAMSQVDAKEVKIEELAV